MRAAISTRTTDPAELLPRVLDSPGMTGADLARECRHAPPVHGQPPGRDQGALPGGRGGPRDQGLHPPRDGAARLRGLRSAAFLHQREPDPRHRARRRLLLQRPRRSALRGRLCGRGDARGAGRAGRFSVSAHGPASWAGRWDWPPTSCGSATCGVNQPVMDLRTGRVHITSHNHGFAVRLPTQWCRWRAATRLMPFDSATATRSYAAPEPQRRRGRGHPAARRRGSRSSTILEAAPGRCMTRTTCSTSSAR